MYIWKIGDTRFIQVNMVYTRGINHIYLNEKVQWLYKYSLLEYRCWYNPPCWETYKDDDDMLMKSDDVEVEEEECCRCR